MRIEGERFSRTEFDDNGQFVLLHGGSRSITECFGRLISQNYIFGVDGKCRDVGELYAKRA